jgi:carbon monoxide dehydrogenase subunit G
LEIENTFTVNVPPDRVYEYLLDVNKVVGCVPGAQLSEVVDPRTFRGKVKIKVGPVTVSYDGVARMVARDDAARSATLEAEGQETSGPGSARATTHMVVTPDGEGSTVRFTTDFTVVGRVAQFGRGIMEDVSKRLVGQMASCISQRLEAPGATSGTPGDAAVAASASATEPGVDGTSPPLPQVTVGEDFEPEPAPIDALAIARGVAADRLRRRETMVMLAALVVLVIVLLGVRRRRRGARARISLVRPPACEPEVRAICGEPGAAQAAVPARPALARCEPRGNRRRAAARRPSPASPGDTSRSPAAG